MKRTPWLPEDERELKELFKSFFNTGECPGKADCEDAIRISRKQNGSIHNRSGENIKKKVNNMIAREAKRKRSKKSK